MFFRFLFLVTATFYPLRGGWQVGGLQVFTPKLTGVDVSHYQREIFWDQVVENHCVDFAFVKATEGGNFVDSMFYRNWEALSRHGIRRGAYHFFRSFGCGDEQANHFLSTVELCPGDFAPVLDLETTDDLAPTVMREEALIWLKEVERALGVKPIIYSNLDFYERHLSGYFDQYPVWIARYSGSTPCLSSGKPWSFWQFSNSGSLTGISGFVDLNIFPGSEEMLNRFCLPVGLPQKVGYTVP